MTESIEPNISRQPLLIRGERVALRPLRESDLAESVRVWTPELRHMYGGSLTSGRGPTMEDRRQWLERAKSAPTAHLSIEVDGRYIGHVGLRMTDESNKRGRFVIGIENPRYWGKGYGTEVTRLMLRYAFETLGLHRVDLRVAAYNGRAVRCYEKAGFRHEGVERDSFFVDGKWHDDILMAILQQDWEELNSPPPENHGVRIRTFGLADYEQVAALWRESGLGPRPSDTRDEVAKKLRRDPELFVVAVAPPSHVAQPVLSLPKEPPPGLGSLGEVGSAVSEIRSRERIVGTVIGGWDGRRGWVYRMAVHPQHQRRGIGSALVRELERQLRNKGALSINIILNADNTGAHAFYRSLGYKDREEVNVMGKTLEVSERPLP